MVQPLREVSVVQPLLVRPMHAGGEKLDREATQRSQTYQMER